MLDNTTVTWVLPGGGGTIRLPLQPEVIKGVAATIANRIDAQHEPQIRLENEEAEPIKPSGQWLEASSDIAAFSAG